MGLISRIKNIFSRQEPGNRPNPGSVITINSRTDGLTATGFPSFIRQDIREYPTSILCAEGTTLSLPPVSSLITGTSINRSYVLSMQIVSAIRNGYTPIVLSANGKRGEVYSVLSEIFREDAIHYVSDSTDSGYYNPYEGINLSCIADFFYDLLISSRQQEQQSEILIRNYVNVCTRVLFSNSTALRKLITGELNHTQLIRQIHNMDISEQEKNHLEGLANSSVSVSVSVLSVFQDYLYKLRHACVSAPTPLVFNNRPRITINRTHNPPPSGRIVIYNNNYNVNQTTREQSPHGFNSSSVAEHKCLFLHLDNEIQQAGNKCFQWYLSQTLRWENHEENSPLRNARLLFIIEDIRSELINWYKWLIDLPNSIVLLSYKDFYSKLSDKPELRNELLSRTEILFFFSVTNDISVRWTSGFFGSRTVPKTVRTELPPRELWELFFRQQTIAHDEQDKPWFSEHEIRQLQDKGIVFSLRDRIFQPCYLENGNTYKDYSYRGKVNFCTFSFR